MDLENFDSLDEHPVAPLPKSFTSADALKHVDNQWYTRASRRARWMDLLGDYAGSEPFVIDGESLFQIVLDDPLLAIGRLSDSSFQILHAIQVLEHAIAEFTQRSANFEIVFWQDNRHATLQTGSSPFVVASRSLARTLLFKHLLRLDITVNIFDSLSDPLWLQYETKRKPMFVMINDGGLHSDCGYTSERTLYQRIFIFDLLSHGIAVSLLRGTEFRDSKILSFVYEQRLDSKPRDIFPPELWASVTDARTRLDAKEARPAWKKAIPLTIIFKQNITSDTFLIELARIYLSSRSHELPPELLYAFVAHCIMLENLSARERARSLEKLDPELVNIISNSFLPELFFAISKLLMSSNLTIDIDGRIFISLIRCLTLHRSQPLLDVVGSAVHARTQMIWSRIGSPPLDFLSFAVRYPLPPLSNPLVARKVEPYRLLPFDNHVFNDELSLIHVPVEDQDPILEVSSSYLDFGQGTLFSDTQHWHNTNKAILPSHLGGVTKTKPLDERSRRRALRKDQRFMATLQIHAATLTGAMGASLRQIIIPPVGLQISKVAHKGRTAVPKESKKAAIPVKKGKVTEKLSSADKLRQKIAAEKKSSQDDSSQSWWRRQLDIMSQMTTLEKVAHLKGIHRNKRSEEQSLGIEMRLYRLNLEIIQWIDEPDHDSVRDKYTVSIMRMVKEIFDRGSMTPTISKILASVLRVLGFSNYDVPPSSSDDRPLSFEFRKLVKSKKGTPYHKFMAITEHPIVWQLRLFGEFMDRSMDGAPDRRVAFEPDAWQRKVLDCIDQDGSLLVVAPTSAGKTFISYYAMEKVLRTSDDGILVYVAPTKALVSQIAAEVYARFSKDLNGRSCWAVHTRDYRIHDPQKCQILVTVPEMLAIMLLSPPLARVWSSRIQRIILDEIHSIGQQEGGAVWEQIILLAPCPIIGLSATIGSPEIFNSWLHSVQDAHGYKHTFIQHPHRYSHLRKFYYALKGTPPPSPFTSLESYRPTNRARFLHPMATLSFGSRTLPPDLALEASDTLSLYRALLSCRVGIDCDLESLEPSNFFAETSMFLRQRDIVRYEAALKLVLLKLMSFFDARDSSSPLYNVIQNLEDPVVAKTPPENLNTAPSRKLFRDNLIYLVADLHTNGELPAILFSFDRTECEIMANDLLRELQMGEEKWRATNPEWIRKLRDWERWKERAKERERMAEREKRQKKDPDEPESTGTQDNSWESSFNPDDPSSQFTFAGTHTAYTKADLDEDIIELGRWNTAPQWALDALRRGIAVHHAGMNKRYRSLVESLFRQGFIRVVIATGTLALGINAPTKTAVFCGDSPFLTALMYRQCAGRAGRRGYDLLGNVVFYGLPMDRVQRLILSRLPSLGGNFPLTSTLSLRLFNLLEGSDFAPMAVKAIQSMMSLPHISFGSETGRHQLLHHLRFSIEYLRRSRLLDKYGKPMNLFGIAAHLYYHEPSNLALVTLLQNGILHKICRQKSLISAKRDFMILMSHLFGRRYLSRTFTSKENITLLTKKYPSMIVLPPLPKAARKVLLEHDQEILRIFSGYAMTYASEYAAQLGEGCELPLSKLRFPGRDDDSNSLFRQHLRNTAIPVVARSLFVANSGHTDTFHSVEDLTRTARQGLYLNKHVVPSVGQIASEGSTEYTLNAYLLDFYIHGQVSSLSAANGIRRGDIWYLLQDFTLTLMTIKATLEQLLSKASKEYKAAATDEDDDEEIELDSGYGSFDPGEVDQGEEGGGKNSDFMRPVGVTDADWRVYEVVCGTLSEFDEKFRAMWA